MQDTSRKIQGRLPTRVVSPRSSPGEKLSVSSVRFRVGRSDGGSSSGRDSDIDSAGDSLALRRHGHLRVDETPRLPSGRQIGDELALSSHPWPLPWGSSRWRVVGLRPLAGEGESRRALRASNDPEVTMLDTLPHNGLIAHSKALEAAGLALAIARRVPAPFRSPADQLIRASSSVAANLSEGHGRVGRDRLNHWRIAYGSAKEVDTFLRLLAHAGAVDKAQTSVALELFDQVQAMTWRLLHPIS